MTYVVTEQCIGCRDQSCIRACPVGCIYLAPLAVKFASLGIIFAGADDWSDGLGMLMINPDECTSCGACETGCPVEAIYEDCSVPEELQHWIALNARYTRSLTGERKEKYRQLANDGQL